MLTELDFFTAELREHAHVHYESLRKVWWVLTFLTFPNIRSILPCPLLCDLAVPPTRLGGAEGGLYFQFPLMFSWSCDLPCSLEGVKKWVTQN